MAELLNLDEILPEPHKIKLGGEIYILDADMTVHSILNLFKQWNKFESMPNSPEVIEALMEQVLGFFKVHHPDMTLGKLTGLLHTGQMQKLIMFIYGTIMETQKLPESETKKNEPELREKVMPSPLT